MTLKKWYLPYLTFSI